ncbi:phytase AppA, partial [Escherichia coli]|nr:phytase AppA [Escherichia coli]
TAVLFISVHDTNLANLDVALVLSWASAVQANNPTTVGDLEVERWRRQVDNSQWI